jgi:hypothetical protein
MRRLFHSSHPTTHDTQTKAATTVTGEPDTDLIRLLSSLTGIPAIAQRTIGGPLTWREIARPIFVNEQDLRRAQEVVDAEEEDRR